MGRYTRQSSDMTRQSKRLLFGTLFGDAFSNPLPCLLSGGQVADISNAHAFIVGDEAQTTAAWHWQKRTSLVRRCLSPRLTG
jgi:hypothetical protein